MKNIRINQRIKLVSFLLILLLCSLYALADEISINAFVNEGASGTEEVFSFIVENVAANNIEDVDFLLDFGDGNSVSNQYQIDIDDSGILPIVVEHNYSACDYYQATLNVSYGNESHIEVINLTKTGCPIPECPIENGATITQSINLSSEMVCELPDGFIIDSGTGGFSSGITLDCNNAKIIGLGYGGTMGVFSFIGSHVTIENCIFVDSIININSTESIVRYNNFNTVTGGASIVKDYGGRNSFLENNFNTFNNYFSEDSSFSGNTYTSPSTMPVEGNSNSYSPGTPGGIVNIEDGVNLSEIFPVDYTGKIIVDCFNATINGSRKVGSAGIFANTLNEIEIRNCNVQNYDYNVYLNRFHNGGFYNNALRNPITMNLQVSNSNGSEFYGNIIGDGNDSAEYGFYIAGTMGSYDNYLVNNTFEHESNTWNWQNNNYCLNNFSNEYLNDITGPLCPGNSQIDLSDLRLLSQSGLDTITSFVMTNIVDVPIGNLKWNINTDDSFNIESSLDFSLNPNESIIAIVDYAYSEPNVYNYSAKAMHSNQEDTENVMIYFQNVSVNNLRLLENSNLYSVFGFEVENLKSTSIADLDFDFDTDETVLSSTGFDIDGNKKVISLIEYNYSNSGNYTVNASLNGEGNDFQKLEVQIS